MTAGGYHCFVLCYRKLVDQYHRIDITLVTSPRYYLRCNFHNMIALVRYGTLRVYYEGILPKGSYLPCVSMAGRALLAGYHRISMSPQRRTILCLLSVSNRCTYIRQSLSEYNGLLFWVLQSKQHRWKQSSLTHYELVTPYGEIDPVNIGSCYGLLHHGRKPSPEPMLTYIYHQRCSEAPKKQFHNKYPWT